MSKGKSSKRKTATDAPAVTARRVIAFRRRVYTYYSRHGRNFPWRDSSDPYAIVVSEIMLQQTQTSRVVGRFERFLDRFPTFAALARAPLAAVLTEWQGLGYNRRALFLVNLAQAVMAKHRGTLPATFDELRALPGVGDYTAGALLAFVYGKPAVFIETNIRAVFLEEFFKGKHGVRDKEIASIVELTLDRRDPRRWYYALMDYGVACKARSRSLNARSAHYAKQPPFESSIRKVRGEVVRSLVRAARPLTRAALRELVRSDTKRLASALTGLIDDGIIWTKGDLIGITGS